MDSITFLILVGFVWLILVSVSRTSWFKVKNPEIGLGFAYYRTTKLNNIITRIANIKESFWKLLWDIGILSGLGILFTGLVVFTINVITFFLPKSSEVTPIAIAPVIPGITISFGSLPYFIVAILVGAAVHEFAHGIAAINEKISLKSTGIFVLFILFGAFVEPNEESLNASSNRSKMRVMAAGGLANMLVFFLILILILPIGYPLLVSSFYQSDPSGVLIVDTVPNAPASLAGIKAGYAFNTIKIENATFDVPTYLEFSDVINENLFMDQNVTFNFINLDQPISLNAANRSKWVPEDENSGKGYIGILTQNYLKPHIQTNILFINLIPYWIQNTIVITASINLVLALMNLLPVPFLDGDKLLAAFLGEKNPVLHKRIRYFALIILLLNFALSFLFMGWQQI